MRPLSSILYTSDSYLVVVCTAIKSLKRTVQAAAPLAEGAVPKTCAEWVSSCPNRIPQSLSPQDLKGPSSIRRVQRVGGAMCAAPCSVHCVVTAQSVLRACAQLRRVTAQARPSICIETSFPQEILMLARIGIAVSDSAVGDINGSDRPARQ